MAENGQMSTILVTLDCGEHPALFVLLAADGTINRLGTGAVDNPDRELFIGRESPAAFQWLAGRIAPELLEWSGAFADPAPVGTLCKLKVGLQRTDGTAWMSQWEYGAESQGPPPEICEFVIAAVQATDAWHAQQKQMASGR